MRILWTRESRSDHTMSVFSLSHGRAHNDPRPRPHRVAASTPSMAHMRARFPRSLFLLGVSCSRRCFRSLRIRSSCQPGAS